VREVTIDLDVLRRERLDRLQRAMRARELEVCVLFNEPNIRYATGVSSMPVYTMSTFVRCAVVPVEGWPILFEHGNSMHLADDAMGGSMRPMHAWEFFDDPQAEAEIWARETVAVFADLGVTGRTVAVDRLGTPGFLALQSAGFTIVDSAPVTQAAREVKTPQEVALMRRNGALIVDMLTAFEAAVAPGVRERDLLAVLSNTMLRGGGEYLATSTVCSGPNANPWRAEATERALQPGELVFVDTDTVGIGGYFFCVSRTFPVPGAPVRSLRPSLIVDAAPGPRDRRQTIGADRLAAHLANPVRAGVDAGQRSLDLFDGVLSTLLEAGVELTVVGG